MSEEYPFRSAHDALVFAFNFSAGSPPTIMSRLMIPPEHEGKGLAGTDGAAQAGMIRAIISSLGILHESVITARYAPQTLPFFCARKGCSCELKNEEWEDAIIELDIYVKDTIQAELSHRFRKDCLTKLFSKGKSESLREIAKKNHVGWEKAKNDAKKIEQLFGGKDGLISTADMRAYERLKERGVIR